MNISQAAREAGRQAEEPLAVNDTTATTTHRHKSLSGPARCSNVSLAFLSSASAGSLARHGGVFFDVADSKRGGGGWGILNKIATHVDDKGRIKGPAVLL